MRPCRVDEFPLDESPYGVRGLGGNSQDWCLTDPGGRFRNWRCLRGGAWAYSSKDTPSGRRWGHLPDGVFWYYGFRLVSPLPAPR